MKGFHGADCPREGRRLRNKKLRTRSTSQARIKRPRGSEAAASRQPLAKITRPVLAHVYTRQRLFGWLDEARRAHPVIWVQAPPGSGKTTLVATYLSARKITPLWYQVDSGDSDIASFFYYIGHGARQVAPRHRKSMPLLTPEYLQGLPAFTRNYFRELFSRLKAPAVVVLDNYQEVAPDAALHEVLQHALDEIPSGINFIILSRAEPPAAFARMRTAGRMNGLGWTSMQLTEEESLGIAALRPAARRPSRDAVLALNKQTHGWAAGLVLMLEQKQALPALPQPPDIEGQSVLFDYFANEVLRSSDLTMQEFLLRTAFLPKISVAVARQLTGEPNAHRILSDLARRNYFTVQHSDAQGSYEYHPLFRAFLTSHATARYSTAQVNQIKQRSAQLLAEDGNIESAVSLLLQANDWPAAVQLILAHAPALVAQGRSPTLAMWLQQLPDNFREESPWALYWLGVCRLPFNPPEARSYFKTAFALFEPEDDSSPLYLAWSGIIDSFVIEWNDFSQMDKWLDVYSSLHNGRKPPAPDVEAASVFSRLAGLFHRRPDDPVLPSLAEHAEALFMKETDINRRFTQSAALFHYFLYRSGLSRVDHLVQTLAPLATATQISPLALINWYALKTELMGHSGSFEESIRTAQDGMMLAESSGVHILDALLLGYSIHSYLYSGKVAAAKNVVSKVVALVAGRGQFAESFCAHLLSLVASHDDDITSAICESSRGAKLSRTAGVLFGEACNLFVLSYSLARSGDTERALDELETARAISSRIHSLPLLAVFGFMDAHIRELKGERAQALSALRDALILARKGGMKVVPWVTREDAASLYSTALEAGIEQDFAHDCIKVSALAPPPGQLSEVWPWPVKIYTLGRFSIVKDDKPLKFEGKTQKKPLELLKALIALGGRDVREDRLAEALWPEAEADAAAHALTTTVHRLRKLIGEETIERSEGRLSLNAQRCWADAWAFERQLTALEHASHAHVPEEITKLTQKLTMLYRGAFLKEEFDRPWVLSTRERLQGKFLRLLESIGRTHAHAARHPEAQHCFEKALEIDPLAEGFYRGLMQVNIAQGRHAEALAVYRRCRKMLTARFGCAPSGETEALAQQIPRY